MLRVVRCCSVIQRCVDADLTAQDLPEHHPVPRQTVQRVSESGRAVVLEAEMSDPGKSIAEQWREQQPPRASPEQHCGKHHQHARRSDEMQSAALQISVLSQVEGIESGEALESLRAVGGWGGHGHSGAAAEDLDGTPRGGMIGAR